jgi:hypothetical protein
MNLPKAASIPGKGAGLDVGREGKIWDVITSVRTRVEAARALLDPVEPDVPQPIHSTYPRSPTLLIYANHYAGPSIKTDDQQ